MLRGENPARAARFSASELAADDSGPGVSTAQYPRNRRTSW
jgi:hypothetical protein